MPSPSVSVGEQGNTPIQYVSSKSSGIPSPSLSKSNQSGVPSLSVSIGFAPVPFSVASGIPSPSVSIGVMVKLNVPVFVDVPSETV